MRQDGPNIYVETLLALVIGVDIDGLSLVS